MPNDLIIHLVRCPAVTACSRMAFSHSPERLGLTEWRWNRRRAFRFAARGRALTHQRPASGIGPISQSLHFTQVTIVWSMSDERGNYGRDVQSPPDFQRPACPTRPRSAAGPVRAITSYCRPTRTPCAAALHQAQPLWQRQQIGGTRDAISRHSGPPCSIG